MPSGEAMFHLSREDIGILMSYATRPERITEEVIARLRGGVTFAQLETIAAWVGLPRSTAARLAQAEPSADRGQAGGRMPVAYRRSLLGILLAYLVVAVAFEIGSGSGPWDVFVIAAWMSVAVYLVYSLIVRLAGGRRNLEQ